MSNLTNSKHGSAYLMSQITYLNLEYWFLHVCIYFDSAENFSFIGNCSCSKTRSPSAYSDAVSPFPSNIHFVVSKPSTPTGPLA